MQDLKYASLGAKLFRKLFLWLPLSLGPAVVVAAPLENPTGQPYPEVRYEHKTTTDPAQRVWAVRIDLMDPDVDVRVAPGGVDPDGAGEYQTTLQTLTTIAEREHFEVAINGDFFTIKKTPDGDRAQAGYVSGKWAKVVGPAVSDGHLWASAPEARAVLVFDSEKRPQITSLKDVPAGAHQVIAGSHVLVRDGQTSVSAESSFSRTRHPRTAVGIDRDGKTLLLVVVDGRRPGVSVGMSLTELAELMKQLGCHQALNLDGGGSSELVMRDPASGELQILNRPSDNRERAVANVLGISIRGSRRTPKLSSGQTNSLGNSSADVPGKDEKPK